jgi:hypothetical protein
MKKIFVSLREGRQIGCELGECMASLENAGIRDYSARIERYIIFWIADRLFPHGVKTLTDAGFTIEREITVEMLADAGFKPISST